MTKKQEAIIELTDVWKTYIMGQTQVHALRGLTLTVHKGEFLAIVGPSGSGKSTAMNMIGALDIPTKGIVKLNNRDISTLTESDLAVLRGQQIGFIFQKFNLIPTLTARENVALPLLFLDVPAQERQKRAQDLLELVGIGDRSDHKPSELSGGQQQRVAIARALAAKPRVILADEPTGNLDSKSGSTVMDFLRKLHTEEGTTIVMVTHDPNVAKNADRIVTLKDGTIVGGKK